MRPEQDAQAANTKALRDLDSLVQALQNLLPAAKPWQRQLRVHLVEVDRCIQVLRLTGSLERPAAELVEARDLLVQSVRSAHLSLNGCRADEQSRSAMKLALALALKVENAPEAH